MISGRIGNVLSKPLLSRSSMQSFYRFASRADARQNFVIVIVDDYNADEQRSSERYADLLGGDPAFPFPGKVKFELTRNQKMGLTKKQIKDALMDKLNFHAERGISMQLHFERSSFAFDDDEENDAAKMQKLLPIPEPKLRSDERNEWVVERVNSTRILLEDVNTVFGQQFNPGREITVISLRSIAQETEDIQSKQLKEEERLEMKENAFVKVANAISNELRDNGFWANFIDPRNRRPYYQDQMSRRPFLWEKNPNKALSKIGSLKIRANYGSCQDMHQKHPCQIIESGEWTLDEFSGQIFTAAPAASEVLRKILSNYGPFVASGEREKLQTE